MDELGIMQDEYVLSIEAGDDTKVPEIEKWYEGYDEIHEYREYQYSIEAKKGCHVKLHKLELPKFNSEPKKFYKWRSSFEWLTKQ